LAIYHFSGQILGRAPKVVNGKLRPGSKAVAAAAYRSGERLEDHHHRESHDYSQRRGVVHAEILAPPGSAPWLTDRELLWNSVEAMEKRTDAQLAREFNMALPHELSQDDRIDLVRGFVERHFVARGMVADIALHDPVLEKGDNARNFHAHVMLTLRRATASGLDPVKTREWNSKELLNVWRAEWAVACNAALDRAGKKVRVDHRTLVAQRDWAREIGDRVAAEQLNRQPEIHVGPKARKMARRQVEPRSQVREVGAVRKREAARPAERRKRDYPAHDRGTRLTWLESILAGNNEKLKRDLLDINRRFDRFSRKLDYWERRATFYAEGVIKGKGFRFERWKAAQEEKQRKAEAAQKAAHVRKRVQQLRSFLRALEMIIMGRSQAREKGLSRAREVNAWREPFRDTGRGRGQSRKR
jgi:hypothetical protein